MNYKVLKNYLSQEQCEQLISDFKNAVPDDSARWHGGRKLIPKTAPVFSDLISNSLIWKKLVDEIENPLFSLRLMDELGIAHTEIRITSAYAWCARKFRFLTQRANMPVRNSHPLILIAWVFYSCFVRSIIWLFGLFHLIRGRQLAEIFYDASSANNGYAREVHRDSDSRIFVFLLYLNAPGNNDGNAVGGELCLHELVDPLLPHKAQPDHQSVTVIEALAPEPGCLVFFENDQTAYHSVPEMRGFDEERYFIYGSLTLLSGRGAHFKKSPDKLPTDFKMYL